jgi:hypothetical protein
VSHHLSDLARSRFTQPLTEISTRNIKIIMFLGSKVWRVHRADNPPRPVTGIALLYGDGVCFL